MNPTMIARARRVTLLLLSVLAVLGPCLVRAADDATEARRRFTEGTEALKAGRYREAALHFEAASKLRPHAFASFTAAQAWDKAEDPARAADAFARSMELEGLGPKDKKTARDRLVSLEQSLGTANIGGPADVVVQFEGSTEANPPARLHGSPGIRTLLIARKSSVDRMDVLLKAGQTVEVDVTAVAAPPAASSSAPPPPPPPPKASAPPPPPPPPEKPGQTRKIVGYAAMGAGVVSAGIGIGLGFKTLSARDEYTSAPTRDGYDHATSMRTWTNVAWVGAVVLGGVGAALVFWPADKQPAAEEHAGVSVSVSPAGVRLGGTF
jgi:hypothetical protein